MYGPDGSVPTITRRTIDKGARTIEWGVCHQPDPERLPGSADALIFHAGPGIGQAEVDASIAHWTAEPTIDPADPMEPVCLPVAPGNAGAAGGTEDATGWEWWRCRLRLPDDVTPEHTAVQVPRRLVGAYLEVKMSLMKVVLEGPAHEADPRWKALVHMCTSARC